MEETVHYILTNRSDPNKNRAASQLSQNSLHTIHRHSERQRAHSIQSLSLENQQKAREELGSSVKDDNVLVAFMLFQAGRVMLSSRNDISNLSVQIIQISLEQNYLVCSPWVFGQSCGLG